MEVEDVSEWIGLIESILSEKMSLIKIRKATELLRFLFYYLESSRQSINFSILKRIGFYNDF